MAIRMKPMGIYVHVPFCVSKCKYCDFNSYPNLWDYEDTYFDALIDEILNKSGTERYLADTIYIGGGTPSAAQPQNIERVIAALTRRFSIAENCEITLECNPATIDLQGFLALRRVGINRISIGMQSADDEELRILGRTHDFAACVQCVSDAKAAGFENISLDLMFGLPEQDINSWRRSLKQAVSLQPTHISCYALKIEEGTPFAKMALRLADEDENREMYDTAVSFLGQYDYARYEISNFARPGFESRHNLKYWQLDEYIGFGAGAHSFLDGKRFVNESAVAAYINGAECEYTEESKNDLMSEFVFLGLRTARGIARAEFEHRFEIPIDTVYGALLQKNFNRGTLTENDGRILFPSEMFYVSNAVLWEFLKTEDPA